MIELESLECTEEEKILSKKIFDWIEKNPGVGLKNAPEDIKAAKRRMEEYGEARERVKLRTCEIW